MSPLSSLLRPIIRLVVNELSKTATAQRLNQQAQQRVDAGVKRAIDWHANEYQRSSVGQWLRQLPKLPRTFMEEVKKDLKK